uniref:Uncharacterized protein n=1 Tax=Ixodes ricinus TaxID=34613 RepID=A0A6B0UBX5_IXORI
MSSSSSLSLFSSLSELVSTPPDLSLRARARAERCSCCMRYQSIWLSIVSCPSRLRSSSRSFMFWQILIFRPDMSGGCSHEGTQILTSSSNPLVARMGQLG